MSIVVTDAERRRLMPRQLHVVEDNPGILGCVLSLQFAVLAFVVPVISFIYIALLGGAPDAEPESDHQNSSTLACAVTGDQ